MFKPYLKIAWRNLLKNKSFSAVNIIGLTIGMAAVLLIWAWVQNELNYDRFYSNSNDLYKLYNKYADNNNINVWDVTAGPAAAALKQNYPEVKNAARMYWPIERLFTYGDKRIKSSGNDVDAPFLSMFDFPLVEGSRNNLLNDGNNIVLTASLAKKIFGAEDPLNKIITVDDKEPYKVTGVIKDLPANTDFNFTYLIPLTKAELYSNTWNSYSYYSYVQLQPGTAVNSFNKKLESFVKKFVPDAKTSLFVYPMSQMHLYSRFENGVPVGGKIEEVRLVVFIGLIILLIACINFINLSTARSQKRAKEVGVRKVIGANRQSLVMQFLSESILLSFFAGLFAIIIVKLTLPAFSNIIGKHFTLNFFDPILWVSLFCFIVLTGMLAGIYPAIFLSAFKPVNILKSALSAGKRSFNPRKVLVVAQFSTAIILIVSTIIVYRQIQYVQKRNIGYNINRLIEVPVEGDIDKNYQVIKTELINSGVVQSVSRTGWGITIDGSNSSGFEWGNTTAQQNNINFSLARTENDFIKTLGLTLVEGRDIDYVRFPSDSNAVLLNETAIKAMGLKNPVGKHIKQGNKTYIITGVFKDFIVGSPYNDIGPMMVFASKHWLLNMILRFNADKNIQQCLQTTETILKKYNPAYPFSYQFVDQEYQQKFTDQQQTAALAALFSGLAIFISCLGLLGLASYMAETRIKEIGIRKVLGASAVSIAELFSTEFITLIGIAIIIATPVTWWLMKNWLNDFTYRTDIKWWYFLFAGMGTLILALLTVSFQAIKAALANPVKSLRTE
ncbi:ABC transporter permease [Parafilimonas terrae]|uniref:ABC-type transport system, involved in lipoprotein release, permease component n=1 Tax=Parafilimonas terrae TaxID=1465490 RepID=A0A1I5VQR4_9BACT|nr:ABC transporter permease [Parafilimonas terrae]SFQ09849.1 ABC-type transport system, involved in lipoprotein release, permease component [Parafilimonas terrae]